MKIIKTRSTVILTLSADDTYIWAREASWPCSLLKGIPVTIELNRNGVSGISSHLANYLKKQVVTYTQVSAEEVDAVVGNFAPAILARLSAKHPCRPYLQRLI